jgi:hypothetical protein
LVLRQQFFVGFVLSHGGNFQRFRIPHKFGSNQNGFARDIYFSTMADVPQQQPANRKRKRPFRESSYKTAYARISFEARADSGRPGSPHRFFASSYLASYSAAENTAIDTHNGSALSQIVHHHANGLCIVTAGEKLPASIKSIKYEVKESPDCSAAEKRKRLAKMQKGSSSSSLAEGAVSPSTVIAILELETGESLPVYACCFGLVLEINHQLTPEILKRDPVLDGYLAVILPSGTFPPPKSMPGAEDQGNGGPVI